MTVKDKFMVEQYAFSSAPDLEQHLNEKLKYEFLKVISVACRGVDALVIVYQKMKEPADYAGQGREFWEKWEKDHPQK